MAGHGDPDYLKPFQPTRPHGARLELGFIALVEAGVSTHAPARGATGVQRSDSFTPPGFNPRARTGRDVALYELRDTDDTFQPTRPHGARHGVHSVSARPACFNPRARTGRDL